MRQGYPRFLNVAWDYREILPALRRGWRKLAIAGVIGGSTSVLAAVSPLAGAIEGLFPTPSADATAQVKADAADRAKLVARLLAGLTVGGLTLGVCGFLGAGSTAGRRYSLRYVVDEAGSVFVVAEYRGLRAREELPLRLGIPHTDDKDVYVEPLLSSASHGLAVSFRDEATGATSHTLPTRIRNVWSATANFQGGHDGPFDFVLVYRNHRACAFNLEDHHARWGNKDDYDDVEIVARANWDEIEIRKFWTVMPELRGDPELVRHPAAAPGTAPPRPQNLDSQSRGVWCVTVRDVKNGEKLQLKWHLMKARNSGGAKHLAPS